MKISFFFAWYDCWIGWFYDTRYCIFVHCQCALLKSSFRGVMPLDAIDYGIVLRYYILYAYYVVQCWYSQVKGLNNELPTRLR